MVADLYAFVVFSYFFKTQIYDMFQETDFSFRVILTLSFNSQQKKLHSTFSFIRIVITKIYILNRRKTFQS
jgi:hypothetical protein